MYRGIYDNSKGFAFGILFCYLGAKVGAFVGLSALLRRLLLCNTPTICFANCSPHTPSKGCLCEHPLQTRAKTFQKSFIKTFRPHTKVVCRRTTVVSVFFRHLTAEKPLCLIAHLRVAVSFFVA